MSKADQQKRLDKARRARWSPQSIPESHYLDALEQIKTLLALVEKQQKALHNADLALNPDQGSDVQPWVARYWIRTTYPNDHPNYLTAEQAAALSTPEAEPECICYPGHHDMPGGREPACPAP